MRKSAVILLWCVTWVSFDIQGALAPVFTPFTDAGELNLALIPSYLQYLVDRGIRAILVGGTTGEYVTLSSSERQQVLAAWLKAAAKKNVKVVAQIGGIPFPEVLDMARFAEKNHANAIMTLPEIYYKPSTVDQLVSYLEEVSRAAPSLPLLYYHFPTMSGVDLDIPKLFKKVVPRVPNFKGIKADLAIAMQLTDLLASDQRVFIANHLMSPAVLLGHNSSIATVSTIIPELVHDLVAATENGDVAKVRKHQGSLNRFVKAVTSYGDFVPTMKLAMTIVTGLYVGPVRRPIRALDQHQIDAITRSVLAWKEAEHF